MSVKDPDDIIDEALGPVAQVVGHFMAKAEEWQVMDEHDITGFSIQEVKVDTPIELDVYVNDEGKVTLGTAPPTQHVETTFMPVFHKLKFTLSNHEHGDE